MKLEKPLRKKEGIRDQSPPREEAELEAKERRGG